MFATSAWRKRHEEDTSGAVERSMLTTDAEQDPKGKKKAVLTGEKPLAPQAKTTAASASRAGRVRAAAKTIAVFVDDTSHSEHAFGWALENIVRPEMDILHIVSIATPPPLDRDKMPLVSAGVEALQTQEISSEMTQIRRDREASAAAYEAFHRPLIQAALAEGLPAERLRSRVVHGDTPGEHGALAVEYAEKYGTDLVVFGSRGLGKLRRAAMAAVGAGSVSQYAVRHMPCPTLVCPARERTEVPLTPTAGTRRAAAAAQQAQGKAAEKQAPALAGAKKARSKEKEHVKALMTLTTNPADPDSGNFQAQCFCFPGFRITVPTVADSKGGRTITF